MYCFWWIFLWVKYGFTNGISVFKMTVKKLKMTGVWVVLAHQRLMKIWKWCWHMNCLIPWNFSICIKQSRENVLICGKPIHGYCITIMHSLHIVACLWIVGKKQHCKTSLPIRQIWPCVTFFCSKKIKRTSCYRFTSIDEIIIRFYRNVNRNFRTQI